TRRTVLEAAELARATAQDRVVVLGERGDEQTPVDSGHVVAETRPGRQTERPRPHAIRPAPAPRKPERPSRRAIVRPTRAGTARLGQDDPAAAHRAEEVAESHLEERFLALLVADRRLGAAVVVAGQEDGFVGEAREPLRQAPVHLGRVATREI